MTPRSPTGLDSRVLGYWLNKLNERYKQKYKYESYGEPPSDVQGVDLHLVKSKIKFRAKKTRLSSLNIGTLKGNERIGINVEQEKS
ncbi:unnamed protein product [Gordionus sp. m RMFG-2023]